jgi:carboxyl-terminal processing protease
MGIFYTSETHFPTMNERKKLLLPVIFAVLLIVGMFIGAKLTPVHRMLGGSMSSGMYHYTKIQDILYLLEQKYVDPVDRERLVDVAIQGMLEQLDPHSAYITADQLAAINEEIQGNFEGIGVQFSIRNDTVVVLKVLSGGPAEREGILGGDRIVVVDGETIAGTSITNDEVMRRLKGPGGTRVEVGVFRQGRAGVIPFSLTRDVIQTSSVSASYLLTDRIAYLRIASFTGKTYREFMDSMQQLTTQGANALILDLRGNGGGLFDQAIRITNEFLGNRDLIVYTMGKSGRRTVHRANGKGIYQQMPVVVLIDDFSASASEILAGAIQDHDRGEIVGRRSFGKGLVQQQIPLTDGSALRVTTERYYTPSGRSIQKPYAHQHDDYINELMERFHSGAMQTPDTTQVHDSLRFRTLNKGRTVYGGGGITPDHFIPFHQRDENELLRSISRAGLLFEFAYEYADRNRNSITDVYSESGFVERYTLDPTTRQAFKAMAAQNRFPVRNIPPRTETRMFHIIKAHIARNIYGEQAFFRVYNKHDEAVLKALNLLQ